MATNSAQANLAFYYSPDTGNVAFNTAGTTSGGLTAYEIYMHQERTDIRFRPENHIRLSNSVIYVTKDWILSDRAQVTPFTGLYTIGDVLPAGLSEDAWMSFFTTYGTHYASDLEARETFIPIDFIYGAPTGEFVNRWDLVDPNTLTWATDAKLVYEPWSGNLLIDTRSDGGGYISAAFLQALDDPRFKSENYVTVEDTADRPQVSGLLSILADALEPGLYNLGPVLDTGIAEEDFETLFDDAIYFGLTGFAGRSFDFETDRQGFELVWLPEPSVAAFTLLPLIAFRRRR